MGREQRDREIGELWHFPKLSICQLGNVFLAWKAAQTDDYLCHLKHRNHPKKQPLSLLFCQASEHCKPQTGRQDRIELTGQGDFTNLSHNQQTVQTELNSYTVILRNSFRYQLYATPLSKNDPCSLGI